MIFNIENYPIKKLVAEIATPFYVYSAKKINEKLTNIFFAFKTIDCMVCYAVKANSNLSILKLLAEHNIGADAVSANEIKKAIKAGIDPKKIVFSGVGKNSDEIQYALEQQILQINVESIQELETINNIAKKLNYLAKISLRINPEVKADTLDKISTGRQHDKFGISSEVIFDNLNYISSMENIVMQGISVHIGSQITNIDPFVQTFKKIKEIYQKLKNKNIYINYIDLGGGFGIDYNHKNFEFPIHDYADQVQRILGDLGCKFIIEPGRYIVAESGFLISKVLYIKENNKLNFAIIDTGMNDLLRPALYDANHKIYNINNNKPKKIYDVVGPICETSDIFGKNIELSELQKGDFIVISDVGAYGSSMSNNYNSALLCTEVLISGNDYKIIKRKQTFEEMIALEV